MPKKNLTIRKTKEPKSEIICDHQIKTKNDIFDEQFDPDISCDSNWTPCSEQNMMRYDQQLIKNIEISGIGEKYKQVCEDQTISMPEFKKQDVDGWVVYRVYRVYDDQGKQMISYTSYTMGYTLLYDMMGLKSGKGKLYEFKDNLRNTRYQLLDCYMGKGSCISTMNRIKNQYTETKSKNENKLTIWEMYTAHYIGAITDEIKNRLPSKTYYIYRIYLIHNTLAQCIIGSYELITKTNIDRICKTNDIYFSSGTKTFELLHTGEYRLDCERLLNIDRYIHQYDTINHGMNFSYHIVKSMYIDHENTDKSQIQKDMHMDVQQYIMMATFDDMLTKDSSSYIAGIRCGHKKFVFCDNDLSVKDNLKIFYATRYDEDIINFFGTVCFLDCHIMILARDLSEVDKYIKSVYYADECKINKKENLNIIQTKTKKMYSAKTLYARLKKPQ